MTVCEALKRASAAAICIALSCGGTKTTTTAPTPSVTATASTSSAVVAHDVDAGVPQIDPAAVQRVIRASFSHFKLCYVAALKKTKGLSGRVETKFVIDESGHVISAEDVTRSNVLQDDEARACIVAKFKMLEFPPPQPSGRVPITYPVMFEPAMAAEEDSADAGAGDGGSDYARDRAPFSAGSASSALSKIDVKPCGFHGTGHVKVTFDPSGVAKKAEVDTPANLDGTPVGSCIAKLFSAARVPPFRGGPTTVGKAFTIP